MIISLLLTQQALAVPVVLGQQGRLLDANGAAITGIHSLSFRITDSTSGNVFLWEESVSTLFNDGYYSVTLGANTASNPLDDSVFTGFYIDLGEVF